jgi:2-oxoisovalerate dehydrogenase E1 component
MSKEQFYSPEEIFAESDIHFTDIPVFSYKRSVKEEVERGRYTNEDLLTIWRDMRYVREFENMLLSVRTKKNFNGIEYMYTGPAHLYIGEEAAAVGEAFSLRPEDFIFGSHRSHGEVIAKGLSAIEKLPEEELLHRMNEIFDGKILEIVKAHCSETDTKKLAIRFLLYGLVAELFGRETGFSKGLGNSMHLFVLPFGIYPNNAIVGGSGPISVGAALFKKVRKEDGIIVCNIGDGSIGCGPVYEAMNFAAMDQYTTLWEEEFKGNLPIIFNIMDNGYAMGGRTNGETMAYHNVARLGAGIAPNQMHAERINGMNPLAVVDAYDRKLPLAKSGEGPVLLDVVTYRYSGHSPSDQNAYRSREEIEAWQKIDSINVFKTELLEAGIASEGDFAALEKEVTANIFDAFKLAVDETVSPRMNFEKEPDAIARYMFSNQRVEKMAEGEPDVFGPKEENSRWKKVQKKAHYAFKSDGSPVPASTVYSYRDAIFEPIFDKYYEDPTLVSYGEDVREWGGAFGVYQGMYESIPFHRLFNSPISEATIVSSGVGYAMLGGRCVVELMYSDFMGRAGDEIFNQLAKWQSMSAGQIRMPVVLRISVGALYGAQHSQDWTSLAAHIPGLKVVFPATPYDAKGLMTSALNGTDPVLFFESQRLYGKGEEFHEVPSESYEIEIGEPDIKRAGSDVTILTVGATLYAAMKAAKELQEKYGISAEVIDARSLVPFNYEKVVESVKKTGRIVLASDACARGSHLNDVARNITELCFNYLDAPPVLIGARNWITPCAELEEEFFPQAQWIIDAIDQKILPLGVQKPSFNFTQVEQICREKAGV